MARSPTPSVTSTELPASVPVSNSTCRSWRRLSSNGCKNLSPRGRPDVVGAPSCFLDCRFSSVEDTQGQLQLFLDSFPLPCYCNKWVNLRLERNRPAVAFLFPGVFPSPANNRRRAF